MENLFHFSIKTAVIGFIGGLVIGFVSKKITKIFVILLIIGLVLFQLSVFNGYLQIDWITWKDTAEHLYAQNTSSIKSVKQIVIGNLPFFVSAIAGFFIGFKKG